tara:strand:+ start:642 stop:893 length:252 start_codon:yes stop_codon:yes gene_type:complete
MIEMMTEQLTRDYMISELQKRVCRVIFTKVNGEERDMMCTLIEKVLPPMKGTERQKNEQVIRAYDTLKGEFRSFRVENVLSFT